MAYLVKRDAGTQQRNTAAKHRAPAKINPRLDLRVGDQEVKSQANQQRVQQLWPAKVLG